MVGYSQWELLKYRFFILGAGKDVRTNAIFFAGTALDALIMTGYSLTSLFDTKAKTENFGLESINLKIQPGSLNKMTSRLPDSAKAKYYPASMLYPDGTWRNIDYRLRGRNIWHWHLSKPSLRLKLSKKNPINLQRHINMVNPEDRGAISNIAAEALAAKLGVLTPITTFTTLYIDGEYKGLYHQTTREDEEFLRLAGRMPGPLFIGDHLGKVWEAQRFENAGDLDVLRYIQPVEQLVEIIYSPDSPKRYQKLWEIISLEKLAAWQASINLVGSIHADYHHNHLFYFDPALGQLEPVLSDANGHGLQTWDKNFARFWFREHSNYEIGLNQRIQPLSNVAFRDPIFLHKRNQLLFAALNSFGSENEQNNLLRGYYEQIDEAMRADRKKSSLEPGFTGWFRFPYGNWLYERAKKDVSIWIEKRNEFLHQELDKSSVSYSLEKDVNRNIRLTVEVDGVSATNFHISTIPGKVFAQHKLSWNSKAVLTNGLEILYPGLAEMDDESCPRSRRSHPFCLKPSPQIYLFSVQMKDEVQLSELLSAAFTNSVTGLKIKPTKKRRNEIAGSKNPFVLHAWELNNAEPQVVTLGPGLVTLTEDLMIRSQDILFVKPGTRLALAGGISIASKGKVIFAGTEASPIKVEPIVEDDPWGAIIIHGKGAKDSAIRYTSFSGGSTAQKFNVKYSGMVSAHDVENIDIENSTFTKNHLADDLIHIVYGKANLKGLELSDCYADCIDLDYVDSVVEGVTIKNAGNDGIDLMASRVNLDRISIKEASDKGISIGEGSIVKLSNGKFTKSSIGVAVKDLSELNISDSVFTGNKIGISIYKKNWRYGKPGKVSSERLEFSENRVDLEIEKDGFFYSPKTLAMRIVGDGEVTSLESLRK